jgi:hypothetical protein
MRDAKSGHVLAVSNVPCGLIWAETPAWICPKRDSLDIAGMMKLVSRDRLNFQIENVGAKESVRHPETRSFV